MMPYRRRINRLLILVTLIFVSGRFNLVALQVIAVQWEVAPEKYTSRQIFKENINGLLLSGGVKINQPTLLVFPEYTSVFMMAGYLLENGFIKTLDPDALQRYMIDNSLSDLEALFLLHAPGYQAYVENFWREVACSWGSWVIGGTFFAKDHKGRLVNQMPLFNPRGDIIYRQNKVWLTPFETEMLNLKAGTMNNAGHVTIDGVFLGFSICRDTFLESWENIHRKVDLWIDIKANGEVYGDEQESLFKRALPARLHGTYQAGATVCLNGSFFSLLWEGPSSLIQARYGVAETVEEAETVRGEALLVGTIKGKQWIMAP